MHEARLLCAYLQELALPLDGDVQHRLLVFQQELLSWNRKFNLTAIRDPQQSVEKHLIDSLTVYPYLQGTERLLDLGSGAGLPAIPLKIARPKLQIVSLDAQEKKILFQRHVARRLGFQDFQAIHGRIEKLAEQPAHRHQYEVVIARALAPLHTLLDWAQPFVATGGRFIAMKGKGGDTEQAELVARPHGFTLIAEHCLTLPGSGAERRLQIFQTSLESSG